MKLNKAKTKNEDYYSEEEEMEEEFNDQQIWIMKPGENSNRGCGIFVCNSIREIIQEIQSPDKRDHTHII